MKTVHVQSSRDYDVLIGNGLLENTAELIREVSRARTVTLVSDDNVYPLYGENVRLRLENAGFSVVPYVFPHGEKSKNIAVWSGLLEKMCESGMTRSDLVAALGGGVVGDLAGFAAAVYQRGIDYVQIPTTLLAAVDSSVGGKTAVDLSRGKNQAGAFHQPVRVICDTDTLRSLPEEEYRCGCAEIIKYAVLSGEELFSRLDRMPVREQYGDIISACVEIKRDIVRRDEFDRGDRMKLNLGHTFGHAAESLSGFTVLHGQGVAMGMAVIARAAARKGFCTDETARRIIALIQKYGLPAELDFTAGQVAEVCRTDKKADGDTVRLIVPEDIGRCRTVPVQASELTGWLKAGGVQ